MMKGVVMINGNVLFSSADYNMIKNVTMAGSLTISSAGVTALSAAWSSSARLDGCQQVVVSAVRSCLRCNVT